jgi:DNA polymerase gamma 1
MRRYIKKGGFMPSRINWAIQSSGVDYLHLLIVSMEHLIKTYSIEARLSITVHDEIRYIVKEKDACRAAMALQISNLWTRAMFSEQVGINDVPQVSEM